MTRGNQQGQASIFVLALIGVVLVSTIFLYQSGRITSEKMQLQNAADAAAFGASTLEARSLNFAAYTNRAMVANEVAIGQMVGMLSFVDEIKTSGEYMDTYAGILELSTAWLFALVGVGDVIEGMISAIVAMLEEIGSTLTEVGTAAENAIKVVAAPMIRGLSIVNTVYSVSQNVYHGATIVLVTTNIFQSMEDNVPGTTDFDLLNLFDADKPGAQLSDLGVLALVGHIPSYWQGYTKRYTPSDQGTGAENEGMQRLAATIREARDPFSSGGPAVWDKDIFNRNYLFGNRNWEFGFGFDKNIHVGKLHFGHLKFYTGLDSKGGSEVRYKSDNYVWSGLDTSVLEAQLKIWKYSIHLPLPTGGGGYQATSPSGGVAGGNGLGGTLTALDMPPKLGEYGTPKAYGSAGSPSGRLPAWEGASAELNKNALKGSYSGLQPYRDMANMDDKDPLYALPFTSPFFLVGVIRRYSDIHRTGPQFAGNLDLVAENTDIDRVGVIAKSEVYFNRPTDLTYFLRNPNKKEKPNVFSPFWQARLAKTSDLDRFLSMAIQHQKIWLAKHDAEKIPGLESLKAELEKILKLF